jgi:hypothetical protein
MTEKHPAQSLLDSISDNPSGGETVRITMGTAADVFTDAQEQRIREIVREEIRSAQQGEA